jgi:Lon protease-like protein
MRELPMFPLGNPAVPHAGLPLHVFEDRYRELMSTVTASDRRFGIVMIDRGSEVGGSDERTDVGVLVEVADEEQLEDGRWVLLAVGIGRIRVIEWLPDDPYPRAVVEELEEPAATTDPAVRDEIQTRVRRISGLLAELGEPAAPVTIELDEDPAAAAWQAVAVTPIGAFDTQRLLEMDDPDRRIAAIVESLADAEELLRLRMAG